MLKSKLLHKLAAVFLSLSIVLYASKIADAAENNMRIVINSASRILSLYEGDKKVAIYPLGLGKVRTPTPTGYYKIRTKEVNPPWIDPSHPEYEVPSGPNNPLGYRWMQIQGNYGIHGTNKPSSIGGYVSNGCIRMLEKDVEDLFDRVKIGTPVEITYNRVVVEKNLDDEVVYYIYPDGYHWQNLNVQNVLRWLEAYEVAPFETDESIEQKIRLSDGEPTFLGKIYDIEVNGTILEQLERDGRIFYSKAIVRDGITYLPAVPIAMALKTKLEWHASENILRTANGESSGLELRRQLYMNAEDLQNLFGLQGGLSNKIFKIGATEIQPTEPIETEIPEQPMQPMQPEQPEQPAESESEQPAESEPEQPAETQPTEEVISVEVVEEVVGQPQ